MKINTFRKEKYKRSVVRNRGWAVKILFQCIYYLFICKNWTKSPDIKKKVHKAQVGGGGRRKK